VLFGLHLRTMVFGLLFCVAVLSPASAQEAKLTRVQVQQLVQAQIPDETIAKEIQDSGLSFLVDHKTVEAFAAKGAGPLTLGALREQIHEGEVEVRSTEPGSQMFLDGKEVGNADAGGYFVVRQMPEGNHELTAKKEGYRDAHVQFTLTNKEQKQIFLPLEWLGGYLSISAQPTEAAIHVAGPQSIDGGATDLKCQPGSYTVTASAEGYTSQTRTFQVGAEEHHAERLQLAVDPAFVASLMADAKAKFTAGNFSGAISSARKLLMLTPGEAKAEQIFAEASFKTGDFKSFQDTGIAAVADGGEVTVPLMHLHGGEWNGKFSIIHDVTLTLDISGITFKQVSKAEGCMIEGFKLPYALITEINTFGPVDRFAPDPKGHRYLRLNFISPTKEIRFHTPLIWNDGSGRQVVRFDFAIRGATILPKQEMGGRSYIPIQSPEHAGEVLGSVSDLITAAGRLEPAQSNRQGGSAASGTTPSALISCPDYDSCLRAGNQKLFHDEDRSSAIPYFQHALDFRKDATGWIYLGTAYLRAGRPADVFSAWNEFLKINKQIGMPVCRSNGFDECESGMLVLGPKNVTWQVAARTVFDVPATKVEVIGNQDHQSEGYISLGLEVNGTEYEFEFVTVGVPLNKGSKHVFTDAQGMAQQRTVGDYISQTIKTMANSD